MNGFALNNIQNAYVGSTPAQAIYLGSTLIWPTTPPTPHDYSQDYLTIEPIDEQITLGWELIDGLHALPTFNKTIYVSKDNGSTWTAMTSRRSDEAIPYPTININIGEKLLIKGNNPTYSYDGAYNRFRINQHANIYGNIMSLVYDNNFIGQTSFTETDVFSGLFEECSGITSAQNLILPATTLAQGCYHGMFAGCNNMTYAPVLSASTLVADCYMTMFSRCSSLSYIKCLASNISASNATYNWCYNISASGIFVKDANATWTSGTSGIPSGWTVINA